MLRGEDLLGERGTAYLKKKSAALKQKGIREAKHRIAERRFQKRHRSKKSLTSASGLSRDWSSYRELR